MTPPLLLSSFHRLRANAGDYDAICRTLAECACEIDGAMAAGVFLRDYAGETLFLAGRFPAGGSLNEDCQRLEVDDLDDPVCYCLHTGIPAAFTQMPELPKSVRLISASPDIRSYNIYPLPEREAGGMGCVLTLFRSSPRGKQTVCQYLCLYAGALLELARGRKQSGYALQTLEKEIRQLKEDKIQRQTLTFAGDSPAAHHLRSALSRVSNSNAPLLITGETGTGKSLLARMVHNAGKRSGGPFLEINCGALPANLLESELFGHVRGAFSGAVSNARGLLRSADGGTVFLDEIGEMPPQLQVALLQVLQEHKVRPVGGAKFYPVNMRIIAATNRDLNEAMNAKDFRRDLYHRLAVLKIHIPPLRERREDIPGLCSLFLERCCKKSGMSVLNFSPDAHLMLLGYSYPGNIRELESIIEQAVNNSPHNSIELGMESLVSHAENGFRCISLSDFREMQESWFIQNALKLYNGDIQACSKAIGVHPRTIRRRLSSAKID